MPQGLRLQRVIVAFAMMSVVEIAVWVTVILYAYGRGGTSAAGLATGLSLLPAALLAPALGSIGDRVPRGAALSGAYAVTGLVLLGLTALLHAEASLPLVVVGAAAVTLGISVARPIHYAALPQLAGTPQSLVWANSATGFASGVGGFAGPALAGIVTATAGAWLVGLVSAVAMVGSSALCLGLRLPESADAAEADGALREAMAGLRHVGRDRAVLALLVLSGAVYLVTGALEILGVTFAAEILGVGESGQGLLVSAAGLGALGGALVGAGLAFRRRLATPLILGLVGAGIPLLVFGGVRSLAGGVILIAIFGLGERFSALASETLLQRSTDDDVLARVFAVSEAVMLIGYAVGASFTPMLVNATGVTGAYLPLGIAIVVLALVAWPLVRSLDERAVFRTEVLALLRKVGFLAAMRPAALDRLSNAATWVEVEPGEAVLTQGDMGDAFYVVESGRLSLAVDGNLLDRTLGPGDGFGEVGLLYDIQRTATVVALEQCWLVSVERDAFLAAVTRSPDGHRMRCVSPRPI